MSTSEQVREDPPDPAETIIAFRDSHSQLVQSVIEAQAQPSHTNLSAVSQAVEKVGTRVDLFFATNFFRDTGEELAVGGSIESIKNAMEELVAQTKKIDPGSRVMLQFEQSDLEEYVRVFLNGDEEAVVGISAGLCTAYNSMAGFLESTLLNSPQVSNFIETDIKRQVRKEQALYYGGIALAAFAGTTLALWSQKRR